MKVKLFLAALVFAMTAALHAAFVNDAAPPFSLKGMRGEEIRLKDFQGQVVFINFWASWCPPCKQEFPELNELANEYKGQGLKVLAINLDKSQARLETFLEKMKIKTDAIIILLDPSAQVVAHYVARSMPSSFIVDKNGVIRFVHFGYSEGDPVKWRKEIESLRLEPKK